MTLTAVFTVVVAITLSSMRGLAMRENESHAQTLLEALGGSLSREVHAAAPDLRSLATGDGRLASELEDSRWAGDRLFRHGYFIELVSEPGTSAVQSALVAWPSQQGRTGRRAFVWRPDRGVSIHPGMAEVWNELERPPSTPPQ